MKHTYPWVGAMALLLCSALDVSAFFKKPITPEYQALVCDWCARYLGRPADPATIEFWGRKLMRGDSPREVEAELLGSREYFHRNGGNNVGFIRGLHRDILATEPVGGQLEYWLQKLDDLEFRDDLAENFLKNARKNVAAIPPGPIPPVGVVPGPVPAFPAAPAYPTIPTGPSGLDIRVNVGPRISIQTQSNPAIPVSPPPGVTPSYQPYQPYQPGIGAIPTIRTQPTPLPNVPVETLPPPLAPPVLPLPRGY